MSAIPYGQAPDAFVSPQVDVDTLLARARLNAAHFASPPPPSWTVRILGFAWLLIFAGGAMAGAHLATSALLDRYGDQLDELLEGTPFAPYAD